MTDLRTAAQQALEALTNCNSEHGHRCNRCDSEVDEGGKVVATLRAALAQQAEPVEPVAWECKAGGAEATHAEAVRRADGQHQAALHADSAGAGAGGVAMPGARRQRVV